MALPFEHRNFGTLSGKIDAWGHHQWRVCAKGVGTLLKNTIIISVIALGCVSPVYAEGMGMICRGKAKIIVAPDIVELEQCAAKMDGPCNAGFNTASGFFAVAQSADGRASGLAGGHSSEGSATAKAISSCEKLGAGGCEITVAGQDDGSHRMNCG